MKKDYNLKIKILHLTLKKEWFDIMITGEKNFEIRDKSKWILSRLQNKSYDLVCFKNGYKKDSPCFYVEYSGYGFCNEMHSVFSNGAKLNFNEEKVIIYLGKVINKKDIK